MRVLVGCEESARVRDAFRALGHDAWSCDILPTRGDPRWHIQGDLSLALTQPWDLAIFHPPCTYLSSSGLHWNKRRPERAAQTEEALVFFRLCLDANIARVCVENPIGCVSTRIRKPDQIIQPWQFGHPEAKATCLWLRNLPALVPTKVLPLPPGGRWENMTPSGQNKLGPGPDRARLRSTTYLGVAAAMAAQWSSLPIVHPAPTAASPSARDTISTTLTALVADLTRSDR